VEILKLVKENMKKVYITPRSITKNGHPSLKKLEKEGFELIFAKPGVQPTEEDQLRILPQCEAYLAGIEPISRKVLKKSKNLRIISRNGVGIDNIDLNAVNELGIKIKIAAGSNAQGVAELTMALIFSSVRSIPFCNNQLKKGMWFREKGMEIANKTLGVIGIGNIGKKVCKMALSLGMKILAYDLYIDKNFNPSPSFNFTSLQVLFKESDIITLHCPPTDKPLIDKSAIDQMKDGIILINTARAKVVDNNEILKGLNSGKIRIYATDVYQNEPPQLDDLLKHEKTIITPHIGGYTIESINRAAETAVNNIINFFRQKQIRLRIKNINSVESFLTKKNNNINEIKLTWLGQAGFIIKYRGKNIIIDPYLSDFLSKKYKGTIFPHIRLMDPPISPDKVRNVDFVFSTHPHTDHLDPVTLSFISNFNPECKFIVPKAEIEEAVKRGVKKEQIIGARVDQGIKLDDFIKVFPIPAAHEEFKINEKGEHSYLGYIFRFGDINMYHSGDCIPYSGLDDRIKSYKVDVALLPINGRDEYRLKHGIPGNFKIFEVIDLCKKTSIKLLIVHHFGMFAYNTVDEKELEFLKNQNFPEFQIIVPMVNLCYQIEKSKI
jgi:D-3-phosphoglycerate dehydrogenase